jgi:hypothetical protein
MLWRRGGFRNGQEERRQSQPARLLQAPPEAERTFYTGIILWMATVVDWMVDGNAYWLKIRDDGGKVVELWWVPHWMMEPEGTTSTSSPLRVHAGGTSDYASRSEDVVHFRFGLDTDDPKLGASQLKSVLREVFTDDEAANFTATLLRNMGVPGLVVSPEKGTTLNEGDGEEMKKYVKEKFGGDKRGEAMVMTGRRRSPSSASRPEQLLLRELRRIPEERVSAVTGIPAIVVGFGAGLERSTFTNMGEARAAAYEAGLIPMQKIMAGGRPLPAARRLRGRRLRVPVRLRPVEGARAAGGRVPEGAAARPRDPRRLGEGRKAAARWGWIDHALTMKSSCGRRTTWRSPTMDAAARAPPKREGDPQPLEQNGHSEEIARRRRRRDLRSLVLEHSRPTEIRVEPAIVNINEGAVRVDAAPRRA